MNKKEKMCDLYYNEHLQQNEIAEIFGTSPQYISKVVNEDARAKQEKEFRKQENAENRPDYTKKYWKKYKRPKKEDNTYEQMKALQEQDAKELSYSSNISDYDFAKWNASAYHRDSKGNLCLDRKLNAGADAPKKINMNIKIPTQKYCCSC